MVKYQAWAAQRDEGRDKERRAQRVEEERAWETVDILGEIRRNLKKIDSGDGLDIAQSGTEESLNWEKESECTTQIQGVEILPHGVSDHTTRNAAGPSSSGEVTVVEDTDSSESFLEEIPEPLPSWVRPFVDPAPTYTSNLNLNDLPSWAIPVINSLPQEPPPSKISSNTPLSLYSPFHQHHTALVLDPTPVESAYTVSHALRLYHNVLSRHSTLSQEAHDSRTIPFLRGPPDAIATSIRNLRFNSLDFLFHTALRRHIGKARRGLDAVKEQERVNKAKVENMNEGEPEKWGRWGYWEEMIAEGEISPPGLGRFRGYMGQKIWQLKNPGQKNYSAPIVRQRWGKDIESGSEPGKLHKKPGRAGVKENWVEEVLMGAADPEPQVEAEPIGLAPELEEALNVLFEKPRGKTHGATSVAVTVEDKSGAAGLPKVGEPLQMKRPIHEEFNEVARAGREHLSLSRESKATITANVESHTERRDTKSVEETSATSAVQPASTAEHKVEKNKVAERRIGVGREHAATDSSTTQDNRARESGAEWFSGVFQEIPNMGSKASTSRGWRTGRGTLASSRPPPFLATDVFPLKTSEISPLPPRPDPASSATATPPSPQSQSPTHPEAAGNAFENWAIKTGVFKSHADRAWAHIDPRTKPSAPRSDRETKWTVHLAEQMSSGGGGGGGGGGGQNKGRDEDLTALERELELIRKKISRIKSNEWWKRNEGPQVGTADFEEKPRTAPDGLWGEGRRDWRTRPKRKKVREKKG